MAKMRHERPGRRHPLIRDAAEGLRQGRLDRRGFLRIATLLGASATSAAGLAAAVLGPAGGARAQARASSIDGEPPRPGGRLRCAMPVRPVSDPATVAWVEPSNLLRHQYEFLTVTGADNITRPMLARAWAASDDLRVWTFALREDVFWSTGRLFDAEDAAFNLRRWVDPALHSPNAGLFSAMADPIETAEIAAAAADPARAAADGVEVVDAATLRLHFATPVLSVPESLHAFTAAMTPREFSGDAIKDRNGTGAYEIVEHAPGERTLLRRGAVSRDGRYWGAQASHVGPGWVDEIEYLHADPGDGAALRALAEGRVDMTYEVGAEGLEAAEELPDTRLYIADTAQTGVARMRVTEPPYDDVRVRRAVQLACDPAAFPDRLFGGRGRPGQHFHVAPTHPDYHPEPAWRRDVEAAKGLLAQAGRPNGIDLTLDVGNTSGRWQEAACRLLAEQAAEAGIRINVNVVPAEVYRDRWRTTPFGLTHWTHRPLGTMALSLAYRSGVPWNETGYANPAFDQALTEAEALIDIFDRRDAMAPVQRMLQEDAVMIQPIWIPSVFLAHARVRGLEAHPTQFHHFNKVWLA